MRIDSSRRRAPTALIFFALAASLQGRPVVGGFFFAPKQSDVRPGAAASVDVAPARIPQDLDGIRDCRRSVLGRDPKLESERKFAEARDVARGAVVCVVVREAGGSSSPRRILGTVDIRLDNKKPGSGYIKNVCVREDCRGTGLGRKLMSGAEDLVRERNPPAGEKGVGEMSLDVDTQNLPAVTLYRKCGYSTPGIHSLSSFVSESTGLNLRVNMKKNLE